MNIGVGVLGIIKNENDEILMQLRNKRPTDGLWGIPGGKVEMYETSEEAIIRECKEELDVDVEVVRFINNIEDISLEENSHWLIPTYEVKVVNGNIRNAEPNKHLALSWFSVDKMPNNVTDMTRAIVKTLKNEK